MLIRISNNWHTIVLLCAILFLLINQKAAAQFDNWPYESDKDNKYLNLIIFDKLSRHSKVSSPQATSTFLNVITLYQKRFSSIKCQFYPSCSRYSYKSINNFAALQGLPMAAERFSRCHQWAYKHNNKILELFLYDPVRNFWHYDYQDKHKTSFSRIINKTIAEINSIEGPELQTVDTNINRTVPANHKQVMPIFKEDISTELKFALSLFKEKSFFRAVTEFKRCLFLSKNSDKDGYISLLIAISLYRSKRYPDVHEFIERASKIIFEPKLQYFARYLDGQSYYLNGNYEKATEIWRSLLDEQPDSIFTKDCIINFVIAYLEMGEKKRAILALSDIETENTSDKKLISNIKKRLGQSEMNKSPSKAAILSSVLPGSGQIYCERLPDGITSFVFTGLLTFLTIDSFKKDYTAGQVIGGLFGLQFYFGNIYGAKRSAHLYNEKQLDKIILDIKSTYSPRIHFNIELIESQYSLVVY